MVKKSIAAALLVAMVAWAEMAMAPMILMHAGHVHPAREMAEHQGAHHHAMPAGHPCCPGFGNTKDAVPLEFAASSLPCQEQHRCCFRQGPQNPPAPVSSRSRLSQEIASAEITQLSLSHTEWHVSPATAVALGPPPGLLGMVLRV
jgi:hypothetical protein